MNNSRTVKKSVVFRSSLVIAAAGLALGMGAGAGVFAAAKNGQQIAQANKPAKLTLVSYAVTKSAYSKIIPLFIRDWKSKTGQDVTFEQSYGGSGSQTRAVLDGLEADVVALALSSDTTRLQKGGFIKPGWEKEVPNNGIVTRSVAVIVTRKGNPKKIRTWSDLTKPGIKFISANPKTSGGARWNFLALWGNVSTKLNDPKALAFTRQAYKNVPVLPKDAREASDVFFKQGQGDALINYENELLLARANGEDEPYVIPQTNISIEGPVAVVDKVVDKRGTRKVAEAFAKFLYTPAAQREFAKAGFRPVVSSVQAEFAKKFPKVAKLHTTGSFGGWEAIDKAFFADGGAFDKIQRSK